MLHYLIKSIIFVCLFFRVADATSTKALELEILAEGAIEYAILKYLEHPDNKCFTTLKPSTNKMYGYDLLRLSSKKTSDMKHFEDVEQTELIADLIANDLFIFLNELREFIMSQSSLNSTSSLLELFESTSIVPNWKTFEIIPLPSLRSPKYSNTRAPENIETSGKQSKLTPLSSHFRNKALQQYYSNDNPTNKDELPGTEFFRPFNAVLEPNNKNLVKCRGRLKVIKSSVPENKCDFCRTLYYENCLLRGAPFEKKDGPSIGGAVIKGQNNVNSPPGVQNLGYGIDT